MNALPDQFAQTDAPDAEALRAAFRAADRAQRRALIPQLRPETVEFAGIRMHVDPRDNYTERMIWLDGQPPEMASLMALIDLVEGRNALILDVGANCGAFTVPLALAAGEGSRVIAFEPNPAMIARLSHNLGLNDMSERVRVESCALADRAGEAVLNLKTGNYGQASLNPIRPAGRAGGVLVPVRCVTEFLPERAGHELTVLKIDVEGAEVAALKPLLAAEDHWPDAILMETRHAEEWEIDLVSRILDAGFARRLEADGNTLFVRKDAEIG